MPKQRANGPRWPGMLQSSKDRAKPIAVDFVRDFLFRRELSPPSWAATADHVEILCSLDATRRGERRGVAFALTAARRMRCDRDGRRQIAVAGVSWPRPCRRE